MNTKATPEVTPNKIAHLEAACAQGWAVFPCNGKRPATRKTGVYGGSDDIVRWRSMFAKMPEWNIGLWCGGSDIVVIDCDVPKIESGTGPFDDEGVDMTMGIDVYLQVCRDILKIDPWETYHVMTPSGGWHFYFSHDSTSDDRVYLPPGTDVLGRRVDVRAFGSYVLTLGSTNADGVPYEYMGGTIQPLPDTLLEVLKPRKRDTKDVARLIAEDKKLWRESKGVKWLSLMCEDVETAAEGTRNQTFANKLWRLLMLDGTDSDIDILSDSARRSGLDDREIQAAINSALRKA